MLSEYHYFKAKSFLGAYKEALDTLKDCAAKQGIEKYTQDFYKNLDQSIKSKHIVVNKDGNLEQGGAVRASYWYRIFGLSEVFIMPKLNSKIKNYDELIYNMSEILESLDSEIEALEEKERLVS